MPEEIKKVLDNNVGVKAVFTTQSETSTGVLTDLEAIGEITKEKKFTGVSGKGKVVEIKPAGYSHF